MISFNVQAPLIFQSLIKPSVVTESSMQGFGSWAVTMLQCVSGSLWFPALPCSSRTVSQFREGLYCVWCISFACAAKQG